MKNWKIKESTGWRVHLVELTDMTDTHIVFRNLHTGEDFLYPYFISKAYIDWVVNDKFWYFPLSEEPEWDRVRVGERAVGLLMKGLGERGYLNVDAIWAGDYSQILKYKGSKVTVLKRFDVIKAFFSEGAYDSIIEKAILPMDDIRVHYSNKSFNVLKLRWKCCQRNAIKERKLETSEISLSTPDTSHG